MKKILTMVAIFAVLQMGFSQSTLSTAKTSTAAGTREQTKLAYPPLQVKANADYMKSRGPVASQKKTVKPVAQATTRTTTTPVVGYSEPKVTPVTSQQEAGKSNDQRIAALNAHIAQSKATEDANKANSPRTASAGKTNTTTLKKPTGLKSKPNVNGTSTAVKEGTTNTKQVTK